MCPLCYSLTYSIYWVDPENKAYFLCNTCDLRFLDPRLHLSTEEEKERYALHCNNALDLRYQKFVQPLVDQVKSLKQPLSAGLDYGCGASSAAAYLLQQLQYDIYLYDPYFYPDLTVLQKQYDFIYACETVEHFYNPGSEFKQLKSLLKPKGCLIVMTSLYHDNIDFATWYYRRDPTHVVFYSELTAEWIKNKFNFNSVKIFNKNIIVFH